MKYYGLKQVLKANLRDIYFMLKSFNGIKKPNNLVFCNSFLKSGTHLLYDILVNTYNYNKIKDIVSYQSLSGQMNTFNHINYKIRSFKSNSIIRSHLYYEKKVSDLILNKLNAKMILIIRDPRAVAASYENWVLKEPKFYLNKYIKEYNINPKSVLDLIVNGVNPGSYLGSNIFFNNIIDEYYKWTPWLKEKRILTIKFEDLVGLRGGGNENKRRETIIKILNYLNIDHNNYSNFSSISSKVSKSHTFRKGMNGQINLWKKKFNKNQLINFNNKSKNLLKLLNYHK